MYLHRRNSRPRSRRTHRPASGSRSGEPRRGRRGRRAPRERPEPGAEAVKRSLKVLQERRLERSLLGRVRPRRVSIALLSSTLVSEL
jgi:hypothetical protein